MLDPSATVVRIESEASLPKSTAAKFSLIKLNVKVVFVALGTVEKRDDL